MKKVALLLLLQVLAWTLTIAPLLWDRRRLTPAQRARSWNVASWGAAVYAFPMASALAWVWVTRAEWDAWREEGIEVALQQSAWLLAKGAAVAAALVALWFAAGTGLELLLGVEL